MIPARSSLQRHRALALTQGPLWASDLGAAVRWTALAAMSSVVAIGTGWVVAHGHAIYVGGAGAIAALIAVGFIAPAPLAALLLLVALNGVPIINLGHRLPENLKVQDLAVFGLLVLLLANQDRAPSAERRRIIRIATVWGACFIGWWTYEFARSFLLDGIPWLKAALFCRYYLAFAILLPLAVRVRLPTRHLRAAGVLLLVAVTLGAIGQDVQSITHTSLGWLVHPALVDNNAVGLTRLYSDMSYLVDTGLIFGAALLLSNESQGKRSPLGALVALCFVGAAVQQFRANYFALVVALLVGLAFYAVRYGSLTRAFVRLGIVLAVLIVAVLAVNSIAGGRSIPVVHSVVTRASSGVSAVLHSTGTVGYREQVEGEMLQVLGHKWPVGLGFLNSSVRYVPGIPSGSITNADTGVFNALMTMGIVGVLLLYAPFAYAIRELARTSRRLGQRSRRFPPWILYGGAAWIAWAVAGSESQIVLFSVPTLVMAAFVLAGLAHVTAEPSLLIGAEGSHESALSLAADAP